MKKNLSLLNELASKIPQHLYCIPSVSEGNIGWHIVHSCMVINSVVGAILNSDPSKFKKKFNFKAFVVLLINQFPRCKAKAPSFTIPSKDESPFSILNHIKEAQNSVEAIEKANKNQYFTHPIFGELNKKETIRFLYVHTYHHYKIIKDILK
jgi:hypothetical protein